MKTAEQKLAEIRQRINQIDDQILQLISQRAECAKEVAASKRNAGDKATYFRPEREAQILRRIMQQNTGPMPNQDMAEIFRLIMTKCLALQQPIHVGYLGKAKSPAHQAAIKFFGPIIKLKSIVDPIKLLQNLSEHKINCAVLALEDSSNGVSHATLAVLAKFPVKICGEIMVNTGSKKSSKNSTLIRYVIISNQPANPSGADKTSLLISVANKPGSLAKILHPFAANQVNITLFESIPSTNHRWDYSFFMEIEGHEQEPKVQNVLAELTQQALIFNILGSYPKAVL